MKRSLLGFSLVLASIACAGGDNKPKQRELPKIRVSVSHLLTWAPIMIADAEGFFRDEGVELEYVMPGSAQEDLVAFLSGNVDVMSGPIHSAFFSAITHGAKVKIVAGQGFLARDGCTFYGIVRKADNSSIKRLRASRDGYTRYIAARMLETAGIDINKLDVMRVPDPVALRSFEKGSIDAIATSEPLLTRLESVGTLWLTAEKIVPDFQWGAISFGERLLYKDRETGLRFLRAYSRGVAQYQQGKTERNVAIISKELGDSPDLIRKACWIAFRPDLRVNWQSIEEFQEWAKREGLQQQIVSRDQAMDSTFLTHIPRSTAPTQ